MAVTVPDAIAFLGAQGDEAGAVTRALAVATALVDAHIDGRIGVPAQVQDQAVLEVTASVFRRGHQPGAGAANAINLVEGVVVREPANPLVVARGILDPFLLRGLA